MNTKLFFGKGINQLKQLKSVQLLDCENIDVTRYVCPICKKMFSEENIGELTQEDAPQDKLGGNRIALTCRSCNSTCGHEIDVYLINKVENFENSLFIPGSSRAIKVTIDDKDFNGTLEVGDNGIATIKNSLKQNDPKLLDEYMQKLKEDKTVFSQNKLKKTDEDRASIAILKNAFVILFSHLGYTVILDELYDKIREQIEKPTEAIVPKLWRTDYTLPIADGIYLIEDNIGFLVVYSIKKNFEYRIMVAIPTPKFSYQDMVKYLETIGPENSMKLKLLDKLDYWDNIDAMQNIYNKVN